MGYRFGKNETPGDAVRRVFLEELDAARTELVAAAEDAAALHEVRKRLKKLRALLRLARPAFGGSAGTEDRLLRDVGRLLARHREADAIGSLLTAEARAAGSADTDNLQATLQLHRSAGAQDRDRARDAQTARRVLGAMRRRLAVTPLAELARSACRRQLRQGYKRTRAAYRMARTQPTEEAFHQWRQAAKRLLNQTRLLSSWGGTALTEFRRRLVRLDDGLGRARDCAFLAQILRGVPAAETPLRYGLGLRARLDTIARDENAAALRLGSRLFRRGARGFARRMLA